MMITALCIYSACVSIVPIEANEDGNTGVDSTRGGEEEEDDAIPRGEEVIVVHNPLPSPSPVPAVPLPLPSVDEKITNFEVEMTGGVS